jgi:preprotein translocase subunit SecA
MLRQAAVEQIDARDCSGLQKYLEPKFAEEELAAWARDKFEIKITADDMFIGSERARAAKDPEDIAQLIETRAREAYARREIEYPIDHELAYAFGGFEIAQDNPYSLEEIRRWVKVKYGVEMSAEQLRGTPLRKLRQELTALQEKAINPEHLDEEVDALLSATGGDPEKTAKMVNERYGTKLLAKDLEPQALAELAEDEEEVLGQGPVQLTVRDYLKKLVRQFYRSELTQLEQYVLVDIFDKSWKDHLYAMDMLKSGIGLHSFAERDPRILYKKEGFEYFRQMMAGVRDKVTDLVFRARIQGQVEARSQYRETAAVHEDAGGYGVSENLRAVAASEPQAQASGDEGGGGEVATKVKQIVNETPKVGRNDPCPCGSGKKYKKCHGQNAA